MLLPNPSRPSTAPLLRLASIPSGFTEGWGAQQPSITHLQCFTTHSLLQYSLSQSLLATGGLSQPTRMQRGRGDKATGDSDTSSTCICVGDSIWNEEWGGVVWRLPDASGRASGSTVHVSSLPSWSSQDRRPVSHGSACGHNKSINHTTFFLALGPRLRQSHACMMPCIPEGNPSCTPGPDCSP